MMLIIDNFDSFTFNLVHAIEELGVITTVIRNQAKTIAECISLNPSYLLIGPGPGDPTQSGISKQLIEEFEGKIPILGVCLGHQCIAELYGGHVMRAKKGPMHGKISSILHDNEGIFSGIENGFQATRYHSLVVDRETFPSCLTITAQSEDGEIMGLRHRDYPIEGVQFHPESVMTTCGKKLLKNFLRY